jgi:site-specific DNA recombinase
VNNLDYFKKFVPARPKQKIYNFEVWSYTRVSSKEQFDNNSSVNRQKQANHEFAEKNGYKIIEEFGGTYESAKSDFTRKEFKRLIEKIQKSRKKPHAILVFKMSRFSRSGGNAIGLVNHLVETLGVHLVEVSSGVTTTTERGKLAVYESLFHAYKENLERKEIIIPNMKAFLKTGQRFSRAPMGYDHHGPRVRNGKFLSAKQKIVINKDGRLLKEAWQWKLTGHYSDAQILAKLENRGLKLHPQKLSKIWRNPFYCGISINAMIDEPIRGIWQPLISMQDFMKVQAILDKNPSGYTHNIEKEERPLGRLLKCDCCDHFMVGYVNKKKNLHYYRCLKCKGVSVNANTTIKSLRKGANELFIDFLNQFRIPLKIFPVVEMQLRKIFDDLNDDNGDKDERLNSRVKELEGQLKQLKIRFGLNQIDKETYQFTEQHLLSQMQKISQELNYVNGKISNLEKLISQSLQKLQNISKIWASSDLEGKRILHKTLFPEGIFYNVQKHEYLTKNKNQFLELVTSVSCFYSSNKNGNFQKSFENSHPVAGSGVEPETFGL